MNDLEIDYQSVSLKQASEYAELKYRAIQLEVIVETLQKRLKAFTDSSGTESGQPND